MKFTLSAFFICFSLFMNAQLNMTLVSNVTYPGNGNDIWGFVSDDGSEYAIVGTTLGTRVYSLADPTNPIELIFVPGSNSTWRDMKQWGDYAYVTCDSGDDGLLIIDMSQAPGNIEFNFIKPEVKTYVHEGEGSTTELLDRCHNIYIDEDGIIYLAGCQGPGASRGVEMFDPKTSPTDPIYLGSNYYTEVNNTTGKVDTFIEYSHDVFVQEKVLFSSEIYKGNLTMYDISDKQNPSIMGSVQTSSDFTHNAWADPTNTFVFTTDEVEEGFLDSYDVSDPTNIELLDKFMPPGIAGTSTIPHNTHYFNGYLVTSWYTSGVVVVDAHKPDNLIQVAQYDTYDGADGGFSGCWGVTPYLPSGIMIANDINSGLYVFDIEYQRACYLEGKVTAQSSGIAIPNVDIELVSTDDKDPSKTVANGDYKTGQASSGTFTVNYSHPAYEPQSVEVTLVNGEVTIQDIQLIAKPEYEVSVNTTEEGLGQPLANSQVFFSNDVYSYTFKTDENGNASGSIIEGVYDIYVGNWGYENKGIVNELITSDKLYEVELKGGYMDDFIVDLGWTVVNEEEDEDFTGFWERAVPIATFSGGNEINPGSDVSTDLGDMAYVTENVAGPVGGADVDNGNSFLISPTMDLTNYTNPTVEFRLWFVNIGGNSVPNDKIEIILTNGINEITVFDYNTSANEWSQVFTVAVQDFIEPSDKMNIKVKIGDQQDNGHIVEGGFDEFRVVGAPVVSTTITELEGVQIYPNPASDVFTIESTNDVISSYKVIDILGRTIVSEADKNSTRLSFPVIGLANGSYYLQIETTEGKTGTYSIQIFR